MSRDEELPWWYEDEEGDLFCEDCAEKQSGEMTHMRPGNYDECVECGRWQGEDFEDEEE